MPLRTRSRRIAAAAAGAMALALATSLARADEARPDYRLGSGDVLQITVFGQNELSGKFRVGPDGAVSYPPVGSVPVAGYTTTEVGADLASRLAQRVPIRSAPAVEISEYAPVFVTGEVEKPGQYAFRPGMVALELLALAGGERRSTATVESRALQLISADQAMKNRRLGLYASLAQKARLEAEVNEQDFQLSAADPIAGVSVDRSDAEGLVQKEKDLFALRKKILLNQIGSLRDQRASYDREITTLRATIKLHDGEVTLLEQETANAQRLLDRELGLLPTLLGLKRQLSATRRDALEAQSYLARAQQKQIEIDQKIQDLSDQQKRDNLAALRELELTIAQGERGLEADALGIAEIKSQLGRDQPRPTRLTYRVARMVDGAYVDVAVDDFTRLSPRDILRAVRSDATQPEALTRSAKGDYAAELDPPPLSSAGK